MVDTPKKIDFIQALRAIAVTMVVVWHFKSVITEEFELSLANLLFTNGSAGVDIFFVVSGFIMVYSTRNSTGGSREAFKFLIQRLIRIWPLYAFGTFLYICFLLCLDWYSIDDIKNTALSLIFFPVLPHPTLDVGWTLNLEIFFYAILAFSLIFKKSRWLVVFLFAMFFTSIQLNKELYTDLISSTSYLNSVLAQAMHPAILEFFVGIAIGKFYLSNININAKAGIALAIALISFSIWQYLSGLLAGIGLLTYGLGATSLVLGLTLLEKTGRGWKPNTFILWIGDISYSIYITHTIIGLSLTRILNNNGLNAFTDNIGYIILLCGLIIVFSSLTHELIEKRLGKRFNLLIYPKISEKLSPEIKK